MRVFQFFCGLLLISVLGSISWSNNGTDLAASSEPSNDSEPTDTVPSTPGPQPFMAYEYGGPSAAWSYEQLTAQERVVAEQGLSGDQTAIQSGYATASVALAARAEAEGAALQLGVDDPLVDLGVLP